MTTARSNRRQVLKKAGALGALAALFSPSVDFAQTTSGQVPGPEGAWTTTITLTDICFMAHFGSLVWELSQISLAMFTEEVLPCFPASTTSMSS
ncbi:MAG: hypothetical protein NVS4B7_02990 [Ktedonobacteraceae bacterium]